jgi:hypothetical protein
VIIFVHTVAGPMMSIHAELYVIMQNVAFDIMGDSSVCFII